MAQRVVARFVAVVGVEGFAHVVVPIALGWLVFEASR
jgi:hypothetical protein